VAVRERGVSWVVAVAGIADPEPALDTGAKEATAELLANLTGLRIVDALGKRQSKGPSQPMWGSQSSSGSGRPRIPETSRTISTDSVGGSSLRRRELPSDRR